MPIDIDRVTEALATRDHPEGEVRFLATEFLINGKETYEIVVKLESFREPDSREPDSRARVLSFYAAWDGENDPESMSRFARAGFGQGIDYHHIKDESEGEALSWPSLGPISCYDVEGLMSAIQ